MAAHCHGQLWNGSDLAAGLGLSSPTIRNYLDVLQDTFMVRELQPWFQNLGKRLVKRPKVYLRDSGLLQLDLVLVRPGNARPLGIEIKLTKAPVPTRGFWTALRDLDAQGIVICPCSESYPIGEGAYTLPVEQIAGLANLP